MGITNILATLDEGFSPSPLSPAKMDAIREQILNCRQTPGPAQTRPVVDHGIDLYPASKEPPDLKVDAVFPYFEAAQALGIWAIFFLLLLR